MQCGSVFQKELTKGTKAVDCKCSVYLGESMCLNRDIVDTAYTLSPPGINARDKLGKECKGTSGSVAHFLGSSA